VNKVVCVCIAKSKAIRNVPSTALLIGPCIVTLIISSRLLVEAIFDYDDTVEFSCIKQHNFVSFVNITIKLNIAESLI